MTTVMSNRHRSTGKSNTSRKHNPYERKFSSTLSRILTTERLAGQTQGIEKPQKDSGFEETVPERTPEGKIYEQPDPEKIKPVAHSYAESRTFSETGPREAAAGKTPFSVREDRERELQALQHVIQNSGTYRLRRKGCVKDRNTKKLRKTKP
ncbi:hypothetical protein MAF45_04215 [Mesosutterella sp. OilRF-GAM-744-9]|uniref:Uncharacterized protein n=1 Tax=Mesosutterella porci TaxID=2915351 RepID=A0ABS9MPX6_9BURK|nr:hypothetical protein [Mesosutterella sp. oilRF-744-WT-GAM-9]MCG5030650.1 hypothetical protein [Mesosutterella sp. oilRF-744-WT-GAM-9]